MSDTLQKMGLPEKELDDETRQRVESLIKKKRATQILTKAGSALRSRLLLLGCRSFTCMPRMRLCQRRSCV